MPFGVITVYYALTRKPMKVYLVRSVAFVNQRNTFGVPWQSVAAHNDVKAPRKHYFRVPMHMRKTVNLIYYNINIAKNKVFYNFTAN